MKTPTIPARVPITEAYPIPATYADELCKIEESGPVTHLLFTVLQTVPETGERERILVVRLLVPTAKRAEFARLLLESSRALPEGTDALPDGQRQSLN